MDTSSKVNTTYQSIDLYNDFCNSILTQKQLQLQMIDPLSSQIASPLNKNSSQYIKSPLEKSQKLNKLNVKNFNKLSNNDTTIQKSIKDKDGLKGPFNVTGYYQNRNGFRNELIKSRLSQKLQAFSANRLDYKNQGGASSIFQATASSFLDQVIQEGDYQPDTLNSVAAYNLTEYDQLFKASLKKLQKVHPSTILPKLENKQLTLRNYNNTSLNSKKVDTDIHRGTEQIEEKHDVECQACFFSRNTERQLNSNSQIENVTSTQSTQFNQASKFGSLTDRGMPKKSRIKYIEDLVKSKNSTTLQNSTNSSPNQLSKKAPEFRASSDKLKPLQEYPRLKQQINQFIENQFIKPLPDINQQSYNLNQDSEQQIVGKYDHNYYLSKRKFSKYLEAVQDSNKRQLELSLRKSIDKNQSDITHLSPLRTQNNVNESISGVKKQRKYVDEEERGSYQMLMRSKTQQLGTLFEQFKQIIQQKKQS
eukprot:403370972